jgi:hypothetical protein
MADLSSMAIYAYTAYIGRSIILNAAARLTLVRARVQVCEMRYVVRMHACMHVCMYACMPAACVRRHAATQQRGNQRSYLCMYACMNAPYTLSMYARMHLCTRPTRCRCMHVCIYICTRPTRRRRSHRVPSADCLCSARTPQETPPGDSHASANVWVPRPPAAV